MKYGCFDFDEKIVIAAKKSEEKIKSQFEKIEKTAEYNQQKMLKAFIDVGVGERHFTASTGYGYDDKGREALDKVYANVFGCEDALVRHNFVNGTHAITVALFGLLRPGDEFVCITGEPYDTLKSVIGITENSSGSLKEFGIKFRQLDLLEDGTVDYQNIKNVINDKTKVVYLQRSRGYSLRPPLFCKHIKKICDIVKSVSKKCVVVVDNCYGEFVETIEPVQCGADLMIGSLIKNPGGGIAPTGGYIAGKRKLVEKCSYRLTTPGTGKEVGATLGLSRELFIGTFNSPHVVSQALKTAVFAAAMFEELGYNVIPRFDEPRADIIEVLKLGNRESLIKFCQGIQSGSPVDSFVKPEPWNMPGYDSQIIMAAGTFTLGSSIELSADAPLRDPYAVWMQGGINYESAKIGVMCAAQKVLFRGNING